MSIIKLHKTTINHRYIKQLLEITIQISLTDNRKTYYYCHNFLYHTSTAYKRHATRQIPLTELHCIHAK